MAKRDLKSFADKRSPKGTEAENAQAEQFLKQAERFQGKSDDQLMAQLMSEVEKGKQEGTFDSEALRQFAARVSPMMNGAQRKKLEEITRTLLSH